MSLNAVSTFSGSDQSVMGDISAFSRFISFCDDNSIPVDTREDLHDAYYQIAEHEFIREQQNKIKQGTGYQLCFCLAKVLSTIADNKDIDIKATRLRRKKTSTRALSREADKTNLENAARLAKFSFEICSKFKNESLNELPVYVHIDDENKQKAVCLTPNKKQSMKLKGDFKTSQARYAFNNRVAFECLIFLAMTTINPSIAFNLRKTKFSFKPLGESWVVREFKNRKSGEILFKIPSPYRESFESFLSFLDKFAEDSEYLFPVITKEGTLRKRQDTDWSPLKRIVQKYNIPYCSPSSFRKLGLNILLRVCFFDEAVAANYGNHAIQVFRRHYELPSQQKAMVEITKFWSSNNPLVHGAPKLSLFNTPCNGLPESKLISDENQTKPDCITPSGCMSCKHYRDEESLDYVWNLYTYRHLKIIESSSSLSELEKPSNKVIDCINLKLNWFKASESGNHKEWYNEAKLRISEGDYHPIWSRKIESLER